MSEDDQGRIEVNYQENYGRLAETERKYDPGNPFHVNQNVNPWGRSAAECGSTPCGKENQLD